MTPRQKPLFLAWRVLIVFALIAQSFSTAGFINEARAQSQTTISVDGRLVTLLDLVNEYRAQNGLTLFKASVLLTSVADWMAQDMAAKDYMSHTDSSGRDPFTRMTDLGYNFDTWKGENLAAGPGDPKETLDLWKNSPGHNANILRPEFTVIGLGIAHNPNSTYIWYWAQEFGGYLDQEAAYSPVSYQLPDVFVESSQYSIADPSAGGGATFSGTVKNNGDALAGSSSTRFRLDVGNDGTWDIVAGDAATGSLGVNATETETWTNAWSATSGTHAFEICADAAGAVGETDETNNCSSWTFLVPASFPPSPPSPPPASPLPPPSYPPSSVDTSDIPDGALIRASGDIDVWIVRYVGTPSIDSGQAKKFKRLILSPSVFENYGHLRWEDVREVSSAARDAFVTSNLVRAAGDTRVFALSPLGDTGEKRWIPTAEIFIAHGFDWDAIYEINAFDRNSYFSGSDCPLPGSGENLCSFGEN